MGRFGSGTLTVEGGGEVTSEMAFLGTRSGATGTARVAGGGSTWSNASSHYPGSLCVGDEGEGTLTVEDGGEVRSEMAFLGAESGSTGMATVTGAGSAWTNSGSLYVGGEDWGAGGAGSVTVQNGGDVAVGGRLKLWKADSAVTVNGGTLTARTLEGTAGTVRITDPVGETALTIGSTSSGYFSGALLDDTDPGSLTKGGTGTQVLAGAGIAYTGMTTVVDGTLKLTDTPSFASAITNDATVEFQANAGIWNLGSGLGGLGTFVKSGDGTLLILGPQDYDAGAVFEVLGGTVELNTDASSTGLMDDAHLSILVADAELQFGCNQHLDTLEIDDGGLVRFTGANVVVVRNLVMNGINLGATTLTPEPATLGLVVIGGLMLLARRERRRRGLPFRAAAGIWRD